MSNNEESRQTDDQPNKIDVSEERPVAYFFTYEIGANGGDEIVFEHMRLNWRKQKVESEDLWNYERGKEFSRFQIVLFHQGSKQIAY